MNKIALVNNIFYLSFTKMLTVLWGIRKYFQLIAEFLMIYNPLCQIKEFIYPNMKTAL